MKGMLALVLLAPQAKAKDTADYVDAMRKVAAKFKGKEGVVLHLGDSITYANGYSGWARYGAGKTPQDLAVCKWMHVGADDDTDGFFLCRVDRPGNRSDTAASGVRSDEYLAGGKGGLPPLAEMLKKYSPQMAVVMLGSNDVRQPRPVGEYKADMTKIVDMILAQGAIPILSTIPPYAGREKEVEAYNAALKEIVRDRKIPMIDYWGEILKRRPSDWKGTLISDDGVHPSAEHGGANAGSEPTEANLRNCGLLLRGWLSVRKIGEVKERVLDSVRRR
jgi:hypothetical protein